MSSPVRLFARTACLLGAYRGFAITLICNSLTSIIDAARHRPAPSPFATHHVALLVVAWGPTLVFGVYFPSYTPYPREGLQGNRRLAH
ncbi:hypothetical protein FB451DRAFT_1028610 [Mycena latifolia]|nr:hypothetical protein FB451DRAFT_1028610 [Mycena latifolia]